MHFYVTISCLYVKFRWLISHVQRSFQPLSVNVLHRLTDSPKGHGGGRADLIRACTDMSPEQKSFQRNEIIG